MKGRCALCGDGEQYLEQSRGFCVPALQQGSSDTSYASPSKNCGKLWMLFNSCSLTFSHKYLVFLPVHLGPPALLHKYLRASLKSFVFKKIHKCNECICIPGGIIDKCMPFSAEHFNEFIFVYRTCSCSVFYVSSLLHINFCIWWLYKGLTYIRGIKARMPIKCSQWPHIYIAGLTCEMPVRSHCT